ncbi:hypothetical protein K438DRAFT_1939535 [Mycena galopus ATCC 62051]|nr:hypothetical protein K438DRAFT_1939535 [Mycena galopus ATCC 62051]
MLLDLSVELLEEICGQLAQSDHGNLRAVCKDLSGALCRLFFSVLVLRTNQQHHSEHGVQLLTALAGGETGWALYAHTLRIIPIQGASQAGASLTSHDKALLDLLAAALASLPKIRNVVWHLHHRYFWTWGQTTICEFLNSLPALAELEFDVQGTPDFSSLQVKGLRKFSLKCPKRFPRRRRLGWNTPPTVTVMLQDIARLVLQNQLNSLHLAGPTEWSKIWSMLTKAQGPHSRIKLVEITTRVVTPELFDYLASYSGVEKLTLIFPDGGSLDESNHLADKFFETVLPVHANTLRELSCPAAYESRFSFGTHNANIISLLHGLTKLEMSVNAGRVRRVEDSSSASDSGSEEYELIGEFVEAEQADIDPLVTLLLETAAAFPNLRSLTILSAETERNRGSWCFKRIINHTTAVDTAIGKAVRAFRSDVLCAAVLHAAYNTYELKSVDGLEPEGYSDGGLRYQETGSWSRYTAE